MLHDFPSEEFSPGRSIVVLETERLTLRQPTLADVKAITCLADDVRIAENTRFIPHPYRLRDAEDFIAAVTAPGSTNTVFVIELDGAPIGMVGLDRSKPAAELGYWIGVDYWGRGYATEAARAMIDYAFEEFDIDAIHAGARVINPASRKILEKCGFQWRCVELHRFRALGSSTPVDRLRLERGVWSSLRRWRNSVRREGNTPQIIPFMPAAE